MDFIQPETYLIGLVVLLAIVSVLVGRQLIRVRRDETKLIKLEKGGVASSKEASELYELASVQLRKRLYPQAIATLRQALKQLDQEPNEAKALIENAMGFALAAQDNFEAAIKHYKSALKAKEDYPVAINNLAFAQERLSEFDEAFDLYQKVLSIDPENKTAIKQIKKLEEQKGKKSPKANDNGGF